MSERDAIHEQNAVALRKMYSETYVNWIEINGGKNKWYVKNELVRYLEGATMRRQNYTDLKTRGMAAPVHGIGISIPYIQEHLSKFGEYCPVQLLDKCALTMGPFDTSFTAEYDGMFYKMLEREDLQVFLQNPQKYVFGPDLPDSLPKRVNRSALVFPRQLELQGYCPVTLAEGPPGFDSIIPGDLEFLVEYEGRIFCFTSEEKLAQFMRTPWCFAGLELPAKLPPKRVDIPVAGLPLIGYLEQSVARALIDALEQLGKARPKYPYKTLSRSAAEYLGLYLRGKNPKSKDWVREKYAKKLIKYTNHCYLITEISDMARGSAPNEVPFSFIPEEARLPLLDTKLKQFFDMPDFMLSL
ncbi:hypothetical protein BC830DRAFT_766968 [Chytriomyces sp. MP71]|nr:hypothetical protein BC830DRAFT_766968 [Chytriomyces sp. MP71]